jgi:hypothetical protein
MPRAAAPIERPVAKSSVVDEMINKMAGSTLLTKTAAAPPKPKSELWSNTFLDDGETTADGRCFALDGLLHPHPTEAGQLACVVAGSVAGMTETEIKEADTKWLEPGFQTSSGWMVCHEDGDNVWRK